MNLPGESYLGDGLYCSYDGFQFRLRTTREFGDEEVFLDPNVVIAFFNYVEKTLNVSIQITDRSKVNGQ